MERLAYCVVIISDTRQELVETVTEAICHTESCILVHVHADKGAERMVASFVGSPETVVEGALNAAVIVQRSVDMRFHKGPLNPVGALHAVVFTPFSNIGPQQCEDIANTFSHNLADLLEVPVYQFNCSPIEDVGYDDLPAAIEANEPIFGPKDFSPSWGTTLVGTSRSYLMFNVNVMGTRDQANKICKHLNNRTDLRAKTVLLEDSGNAVIGCEILDCNTCGLNDVMDTIREHANEQSIAVVGSHIVGSIPLQALIKAADYYIEKENVFLMKEQQKLRFVIDRLGLNSVSEFKPESKVIEYVLGVNRHGPLQSSTVQQFVESVGSRTSTPGGGSVSALVTALGLALGQMTGWMTYGSKKHDSAEKTVTSILPVLHKTIDQITPLIDADAMAFSNYLVAQKMPAANEEETARKQEALEEALLTIIHVPMKIMELGCSCWAPLEDLSTNYNASLKSDLQVAIKCIETGIWGAYKTVMINLDDVLNDKTKQEIAAKARKLLETSELMSSRLLAALEK
ncbi:formimidoyltransferase-cyclodeaminase-like isoform X2 [Bolinopsis microptera]|uniref:formimidoyltransferase-cyclodeaminase-like isoform X2 n=1 Tax=Bolinopsis microptera TaxID=2820187 RepID=UPI003079A2BE